jgi:hypothetical protein
LRVDLPGDGWAEILPVGHLRNGDRKAINQHIKVEVDMESGKRTVTAAMNDDITDAMLCRVVEKWSLPFPVPGEDPRVLGELTLEQADALAEAVQPHLKAVMNRQDTSEKGSDPTKGSPS